MRNLVLLFTIYLMGLMLFPCGDSFAHNHENINTELVQENSNQHYDVCSSLCSCKCCGQVNYREQILVFSFLDKENYRCTIKHYQNKKTQKFSGFIWQPPKAL